MAGPSGGPSSSGGHGGGHSGHGGREDPAMAAFFARRQAMTERVLKYYAAGLCGLIAIFIIFRWTRLLCAELGRSKKPAGVLFRPFVVGSRLIRNLLVRKMTGFKSAGHALVITAFVAMNVAVAFTNVEADSLANFAARLGWMALANMVLVIFLALKNTPLAFLTAYSYERLNCLHQVAGYTMFIQMVLHAAMYTAFFKRRGLLLVIFAQRGEIAAIVCGFAFLSVVFSALVVRRLWYEVFYVAHVVSWIVAVVAVGLHQPEFGKKTLIVTLIAASIWLLDRAIRGCRVLYHSINNEATLHPLPNGGTKIVLKKAPGRTEPGKHCFVWIPAIRKFETHPFTIHKSSPVEFTVKARDGFTRDLHKYAAAHPGVVVRASVDGPYGTFPDPMDFDKIVLIAGGGGATFTFGLAVNLLERMDDDDSHRNIVFIWSVREQENLLWFREQLDMLRTNVHSKKVNVSLYVTRAPSSTSDLSNAGGSHGCGGPRSISCSDGADSPSLSPVATDPEKNAPPLPAPAIDWPVLTRGDVTEKEMMGRPTEVTRAKAPRDGSADSIAVTTTTTTTAAVVAPVVCEYAVKVGRPDVAALIRDAVAATPRSQRVLVAACGPDGLMRVVRDTTARLITGDGPAVELHCEQFGW